MNFDKIFYQGKEVKRGLNAPTETILIAKDAKQADEWRKGYPGIRVYLEQQAPFYELPKEYHGMSKLQ